MSFSTDEVLGGIGKHQIRFNDACEGRGTEGYSGSTRVCFRRDKELVKRFETTDPEHYYTYDYHIIIDCTCLRMRNGPYNDSQNSLVKNILSIVRVLYLWQGQEENIYSFYFESLHLFKQVQWTRSSLRLDPN